MCIYICDRINDDGYFKVLLLQRALMPSINKKKRCEHRIRINQQIKSTAHDAKQYMK